MSRRRSTADINGELVNISFYALGRHAPVELKDPSKLDNNILRSIYVCVVPSLLP